MRRILSNFLIFAMLFCLSACGNEVGNLGDETLNTDASSQSAESNESTEEETFDAYVGAFYKKGGGAHIGYMVTESGVTERLEEVYGEVTYTNDGKYVVWRDDTTVYKKQAGKNEVCISKNANNYYLNEKSGMLIVFGNDGVYATHNVSEDLEKISDISKKVYQMSISDDGTLLAYIAEGALYLINLNSFSVDTLVSENVKHGSNPFICRSATEIYYSTEEETLCWNGTSSIQKSLPDTEDIECESPNGRYVIKKDNGVYCRFLRSDNGELSDRTELENERVGLFFVTDEGVAGAGVSDKVRVYFEGKTHEFVGKLSGYYYQLFPPCVEETLYYIKDSSTLVGFNVSSGESTVVAENVSYYHVLNGYCYYVTADKNMYRVGISEKIDSNPSYMNGTGFMY